jgi:hypothetical protein
MNVCFFSKMTTKQAYFVFRLLSALLDYKNGEEWTSNDAETARV